MEPQKKQTNLSLIVIAFISSYQQLDSDFLMFIDLEGDQMEHFLSLQKESWKKKKSRYLMKGKQLEISPILMI